MIFIISLFLVVTCHECNVSPISFSLVSISSRSSYIRLAPLIFQSLKWTITIPHFLMHFAEDFTAFISFVSSYFSCYQYPSCPRSFFSLPISPLLPHLPDPDAVSHWPFVSFCAAHFTYPSSLEFSPSRSDELSLCSRVLGS